MRSKRGPYASHTRAIAEQRVSRSRSAPLGRRKLQARMAGAKKRATSLKRRGVR